MPNKKSTITITTDGGERVEALVPVVISASRATDIPAFYSSWFFHRLRRGYCVWINPFNNNQRSYVSFERCRVIVFWTKNPRPILPYLHELDERGIHYYFQMTLNDYEAEGFEPNVPPLAERIATFRELAGLIGRERVIWRFDPLIFTPSLPPRELLRRIWMIGNQIAPYTEKLVFSFVDVRAYRKVQQNLVKETSCFTKDSVMQAEMDAAQRQEMVEGLVRLRDMWAGQGWHLTLATCAEDMELESYGIVHNRCIDGELMERLFGDDKQLLHYLRTGEWIERSQLERDQLQGQLPFDELSQPQEKRKNMKDKGQRKICGCMVSKDIGLYNTCRHFCAYCYANASREAVQRNVTRHKDDSESLIS